MAFLLAIVVLATGHKLVAAAEQGLVEPVTPTFQPVGAPAATGSRPVVVAVGATPDADAVVDSAAALARDLGAPLEIVHVRETVVVEELAIDAEDESHAHSAVLAHLDRLAAHGIAATGQVLTSVGDHATAGKVLAEHSDALGARTVAVGRSARGPVGQFADGSFTAALTGAASGPVVLLDPDREPYELTATSLAELRGADQ